MFRPERSLERSCARHSMPSSPTAGKQRHTEGKQFHFLPTESQYRTKHQPPVSILDLGNKELTLRGNLQWDFSM